LIVTNTTVLLKVRFRGGIVGTWRPEREKITRRFWPSDLRIFERWPIGATGKIDRRMIIAEISKQT
jgi:hypothetical protein